MADENKKYLNKCLV